MFTEAFAQVHHDLGTLLLRPPDAVLALTCKFQFWVVLTVWNLGAGITRQEQENRPAFSHKRRQEAHNRTDSKTSV